MKPRNIVITGASSGIGAALAGALAAPGRRLLLVARSEARLAAVAERVRAAGGAAECAAIDVRAADPLAGTLTGFDARAPVDLLIANAGISGGTAPDGRWESRADAARVVETNLIGAINTVSPLLPALRARGAGRVVLMSSLAALRPLPDMAAYGASKAGLRAYGTALRGALRPHGVGVTVICPGFVTSPMTARHRGARPFEMPADRAALRILTGVARGRAVVSFPRALAFLSWADRCLPAGLSDRLAAGFAARIAAEEAER
ncbi:hypothetical protein LNKW23_00170 [Paralimibaculum aggregatum]|uniref:Ketoreductase domain-containing protein n=1 Tax=Paralimibaculum aggregatum TaxID=3036245 RepID=A0ABQ6LBM0_9RHOB|nr:SDR family NAD(P)-dependent oxidoreductase [Limibaculum sp. NKW23]GMG80805.1 hypothetical protein LNKW23_00170 [Limibaculum sp. NKW23]